MTELPPKIDPPDLKLRAAPRSVTRLSRRALVLLTAGMSALVFAATWYALGIKPLRITAGGELYNTDTKPAADALSGLPKDYAGLSKPPPQSAPKLGPPQPGDLGRPMLPSAGNTPSAGEDPARADAQRREQASMSNVMFAVSARPAFQLAGTPTIANVSQSGADDHTESPSLLDPDSAQNLQDRKLAFVNGAVDKQIYSRQRLQHPASLYELLAGTVIPAALVTGLNSDLPGQIVGQVTEDVYDSISGRYLLVPQGTKLIGKYDNIVAYGQERVLLIWTRMIFPDGSSIVLDNLEGTDTQGYAGLEDGVDQHTWRLLKGVALSTLLGVSSELAANNGTESGNRIVVATRDSANSSADQVGQKIVGKDLAIQPTLTIRPGFPVRVLIGRDIILNPYEG